MVGFEKKRALNRCIHYFLVTQTVFITKRKEKKNRVMVSTSNTRTKRPCAACSYTYRNCSKYCREADIFKYLITCQDYETIFNIFSVKNAAKFLSNSPEEQYQEIIFSLLYEAKARIENHVGGCAA